MVDPRLLIESEFGVEGILSLILEQESPFSGFSGRAWITADQEVVKLSSGQEHNDYLINNLSEFDVDEREIKDIKSSLKQEAGLSYPDARVARWIALDNDAVRVSWRPPDISLMATRRGIRNNVDILFPNRPNATYNIDEVDRGWSPEDGPVPTESKSMSLEEFLEEYG